VSKHPLVDPRQRCRAFSLPSTHRGDGKRFVVRADEILTALRELGSATRGLLCGAIHDELELRLKRVKGHMKQHEVAVPQIGLIAGTRAMLGAGIALLLSEKLTGPVGATNKIARASCA
jgi:hypothetical protein